MLLRPKTNERIENNIKYRYFRYQQCLMNSKTQSSQLISFILQILHFLPTVCIFFRGEQFQDSIMNKIFSFFIWSQIHTKFDISQMVILVIMSLFGLVFIVCSVYTFVTQKTNSFSFRLMANLLKFVIFFVVPFTQLHLSVIIKKPIRKVDRFFQSFSILTLIFGFTLSGLFLKFKIKPLRKNHIFWRFTNQYELERYFLNVMRTMIFVIDGITVASLVISLGLEYLLRLRIKKYHQKEYLLQIQAGSNLVLSAHFALLCYMISNETEMSSKLFLCLIILSLLKGIHDYFNQNNKPLLFPLCSQSPYLFYDFYFKLYQRFHQKATHDTDSNQKFYYTTLKEHSRRCKAETCPLKNVCLMKKNIMPQVENFVSQVLSKNKYYSPDLQILEQLWKLQRGKKFSFRQLQGRIDLQTQFIIFSIQNSETTRQADSGVDSFISENNIQQVNSAFYDPLLNILRNFSQFYTQILKPKPKIQTITRVGEKIRIQVEIIQQLYMDLLKKKVITFKAIELYIQFENYFLKCNSLSPQLLKKITTIQKNTRIEDIQQIYLPAINFYPQSHIVEDANMECLGFLRYTRFQLKTKTIHDILVPNFNVEAYFELSEQQLQNSLMFIKKKQNQFVCGNIRINLKFINNKRIFVLVFDKKKRQQGTNFVLVDNEFDIIHMTKQVENLKQKRHPQNITIFNWREIFETQLKPHKRQLKLTKLIKIDLKQMDSILMCTLNKTLNPQYSVVTLRMMKNLKDVVRQRRSNVAAKSVQTLLTVVKKQKFFFSFDLQDQKSLVLRGQKSIVHHNFQKRRSQTQTLDYFSHKMRTNVVNFTLIKNQHFAKGIKTYRLIGQDLYNVDLQDKQAYISAFDDMKRNSSENSHLGKSPVDVYIIALVVIVAIILTGLSFYLLFSLQINMEIIDGDFTKINEINTFKMDFYRILAMLRDVASGLYQHIDRDWVPDVMESYDNIFSTENKRMFSNNQVEMNYRDFMYKGNLNQLMQVILSDVFRLTHEFHSQVIEYIHSTSIQQLTNMIENEDDYLQNRIVINLTELGQLKNWLGIGTIVGIITFYILIFYFGFNLVATMKRNLNELMMISDNQARQSMQNAQKLIYVIEMTKKNFQIDFKNLFPPRKRYRPRKKQKQIIVGPNLKFISIGSMGTLFFLNIMFILAFYLVLQSSFANFKQMKIQGETIIGIYSDFCRQTNYIDHTKIINNTAIDEIRFKLQVTQQYLDQLMFLDKTNQNIRTYFLFDSCPMVYMNNYVNKNLGVTCQRATPTYETSNPFTIGLLLYFTRSHYNIINNITDTYAMTGAYSSIFSKVFTEMSKSIKNDESQILGNFIVNLQIWCIFLISINIFYCLFAVFLSIYVKKKGQSVEKLIKFLNPRKQYQVKNKSDQNDKKSKSSLKQPRKQRPKQRIKRLSILQNQIET